ncbi:hypothetical protein A0H81_03754 [Grifola frondosa]|uniref:Uncharacterized protein n=1 Tax=Grifola frondosa TaxID=5627 RepID=A0A1C7MJD9_GRIFR|nr:hypothetical protein A0H81_03754 [Grifola frondosa]
MQTVKPFKLIGMHTRYLDQVLTIRLRITLGSSSNGQIGAGHPPEEEDSTDDSDSEVDLSHRVADSQQSHIRHDPIDVPDHTSPFPSDELRVQFFTALDAIRFEHFLPAGYGLLQGERDNEYETHKQYGYCTALDEDLGRPCTCKRYEDPKETIPGKRTVCRECAHGKSNHDGEQTPSHNSRVTEIIRGLQKVDPIKLAEARSETNMHFRKPGHDVVDKNTKAKTASKTKGKSLKSREPEEKPIRIYSVLAWPSGIDPNTGELENTAVPDELELRNLRVCGLGLASSQADPLVFLSSWSSIQMHNFLCDKLPLVFKHMAKDAPWIMNIECSDDIEDFEARELPYVMLFPVKGVFKVTGIKHPNGEDYNEFRGRDGAGPRESHIYITPRKAITHEVYQSWSNKFEDNGTSGIMTNGKLHGDFLVAAHTLTAPTSSLKHNLPSIENTTTDEEIERGPLASPLPRKSRSKRKKTSID